MRRADPNRPRDRHGRYLRALEDVQRDADACRLRQRGHTYQQIADTLCYPDRTQARRGVERAMADVITEPAEEVRRFELDRLDHAYRAALAVLEREHLVVDHGKVVYHDDRPLRDDAPVLQAIDRILRIQERRAKLLGLDAPAKVQVITDDDLDREYERLVAELADFDAPAAGPDRGDQGAAPPQG